MLGLDVTTDVGDGLVPHAAADSAQAEQSVLLYVLVKVLHAPYIFS